MEYCHECWNTKGELYFRLDEIDLKKINLFRCCYLEPYKSIDVSDINNIDIKELFNESLSLSPILQEPIKDRCFSCNNLSQKLEKISISLSRACNLNCYHCFFNEHKDTPEMKNAYFSLLEKTKGLSLEELKLTDIGEPFFYFIDTFNFLKKLSFKKDTKKIIFITNLTLLNINRIKLLKKISDITHIQYEFNVSIDGITKETYENTRIGGNFDVVMQNLKDLVEVFGISQVCINHTIKKPNFSNNKIKSFFENFGLKDKVYITYDLLDEEAKRVFLSIKE